MDDGFSGGVKGRRYLVLDEIGVGRLNEGIEEVRAGGGEESNEGEPLRPELRTVEEVSAAGSLIIWGDLLRVNVGVTVGAGIEGLDRTLLRDFEAVLRSRAPSPTGGLACSPSVSESAIGILMV